MRAAAKKRLFPSTPSDGEVIRAELLRILESRHLRQSKRAQQFLEYVVNQAIASSDGRLKERQIGIEVFGRSPDYATGDDPVVRVVAGEVRRRLEAYQAEALHQHSISIQLPLGGYTPFFFEIDKHAPKDGLQSNASSSDQVDVPQLSLDTVEPRNPELSVQANTSEDETDAARGSNFWKRVLIYGCALFVVLILAASYIWKSAGNDAATSEFWGPIYNSGKPVLVALSKPAFYLPSQALFDRYKADHPGEFATALQRHSRTLPLDPQATIRWGDMQLASNAGPAIGAVRAVVAVTNLFSRRNVPFTLRFGDTATFTDSRETPTVIIGALNNDWMVQAGSDLHFVIDEKDETMFVRDKDSKDQSWKVQRTSSGWKDYVIITRELQGPAGGFTIMIEGLTDGGTEAGSELLTTPEKLRTVLKKLPRDWERKNLQLVLSTDIVQFEPGPLKLVASYLW